MNKLIYPLLLKFSTSSWIPYDTLYTKGVHAYEQADWASVIKNMDAAIDSYSSHNTAVKLCYQKCKVNKLSKTFPDLKRPYGVESISAISFTKKSCLNDCLSNHLGGKFIEFRTSKQIKSAFKSRKFFDYRVDFLNIKNFKF